MKKILLSAGLLLSIGLYNQSKAQCNGASVSVTNFIVIPGTNIVTYSFDWTFIQGNASIQVVYLCNGVEVGSEPCLPFIKDSAAGPHHVSGVKAINCTGTIRVQVWIWASNQCNGTHCAVNSPSQSPLPVNLKTFTAVRSNRSSVALRWETATEQNNSGFAVDRKTNGGWEEIAFVPTQALEGNSSTSLAYQFSDPNGFKSISQYRIRQVDFDGMAKLSDIRSVRGEGQNNSTIVYPNPSSDGKVNVVFEGDMAKRNITVQDMSGRIVKEWRSYTNNNIQIENLTPGFYTIRIVNIETGEQDVEKAVVNKR
jgi:hypothetical protein